ATYNVPIVLQIEGRLDTRALEQSLNEIVRRHEPLRTVFEAVNGVPVQRITPPAPLNLPIIHVAATPDGTRIEHALTLAQREIEKPFELERGPLFRAQVLRLGETEHLLVLTVHHSVFDGWSIGILYRELAGLYGAFSTDQPSPLPDVATRYV